MVPSAAWVWAFLVPLAALDLFVWRKPAAAADEPAAAADEPGSPAPSPGLSEDWTDWID